MEQLRVALTAPGLLAMVGAYVAAADLAAWMGTSRGWRHLLRGSAALWMGHARAHRLADAKALFPPGTADDDVDASGGPVPLETVAGNVEAEMDDMHPLCREQRACRQRAWALLWASTQRREVANALRLRQAAWAAPLDPLLWPSAEPRSFRALTGTLPLQLGAAQQPVRADCRVETSVSGMTSVLCLGQTMPGPRATLAALEFLGGTRAGQRRYVVQRQGLDLVQGRLERTVWAALVPLSWCAALALSALLLGLRLDGVLPAGLRARWLFAPLWALYPALVAICWCSAGMRGAAAASGLFRAWCAAKDGHFDWVALATTAIGACVVFALALLHHSGWLTQRGLFQCWHTVQALYLLICVLGDDWRVCHTNSAPLLGLGLPAAARLLALHSLCVVLTSALAAEGIDYAEAEPVRLAALAASAGWALIEGGRAAQTWQLLALLAIVVLDRGLGLYWSVWLPLACWPALCVLRGFAQALRAACLNRALTLVALVDVPVLWTSRALLWHPALTQRTVAALVAGDVSASFAVRLAAAGARLLAVSSRARLLS